jgi:hypothetical protein
MQLLRATLLLSIFVILAAVNSPLALAAQSTGQGGIAGVLTGTVTDGTGAVVVGAHVTVRNAAGASLSVLTDGNGKFRFTALRSGPHVVVVKQQGFTDNTTENVNVSAGETSDISVVLQPLSAQTSVTVLSDRVDQIETVTSAVSSTLNEKEVLSFPTNGRNLLSFVSLSAGVSNQTGQDEIKVGVVGSAKFAVNGGRTEYNSFLVDGNDVLNTDISASHGESTLLVYPSIDAIKELKVMTSNYGAEYGRSASGTVLVSLKSGTDRLHGSAYEFLRNEFFNARNYFDHDTKAPLYRRNDFGGSIGGPLFIPHVFNTGKDKSFFFISEEVRKEQSPEQFSQGVPSDAERGYNTYTGSYGTVADFSDVCPSTDTNAVDALKYPDCPTYGGGSFPRNQVPISATAHAFLQAGLIPRANATTGCISSIGSCYDATVSPATDYRQDLGMFDQTLPLRTHLSLSIVHDHWQTVVPIPHWSTYGSSFPTVQNDFKGPGMSAIVHLTTQVGKAGINDFSYGYTLQRISLTDIPGPGVNLSRAGLNGVPMGAIFSNTGNKLPALVFGGNNKEYGGAGFSIDTSFEPWNNSLETQTIRNAITQFWNKHSLLMGIQLLHAHRTEMSAANGGNTGNVQGTIFFSNVASQGSSRNPFADFLIGNAQSSPGYIQAYAQDNVQLPYKVQYVTVEPYIQDDWKITPHLTLNLGFRLSIFSNWQPKDVHLFNWDASHFDSTLLAANSLSINTQQGYLQSTTNQTPLPFGGPAYNFLYNGLVQCGTSTVHSSCQTTHLFNPAPRLGFAWDPTGSGRYSIRGGYGVFFEHGTGSEANSGSLLGNPPYVLSVQQGSPISYGLIGHSSPQSSVVPAFPLNMTSIPTKTIWPYVQQWSFGVQAQLPSNTFMSLSYVGSKGTHLAEESQANQLHRISEANNPFPTGTPTLLSICNSEQGPLGYANPSSSFSDYQTGVTVNYNDNPSAFTALYAACNGTPNTYVDGQRTHLGWVFDPNYLRPLQGIGRVQTIRNDASSVYHSMQMSLRRSRGPLELAVSYTYSHSIDSASDRYESTFVDTFDLAANRASSSFDQRHLANFSYVYQLPLLDVVRTFHNLLTCSEASDGDTNCPPEKRLEYGGPSALTRSALSDWSLSGILLFQTGSPFSVVNSQSPNGVSVVDNAGLLIGGRTASYADIAANGVPCVPAPRQLKVSGTFGPLLGNPCRFQAPRGLTQGNTGRNYLNNPSRLNLDVALLRNIKVIREANIQFRAEVFNVFNNTQFIIYDPTRGNTAANTISCYGDIYSTFSAGADDCKAANALFRPIEAHRPRTMQFGLKLEF